MKMKMKKSILILGTVVFLFVGGTIFTGCNNHQNGKKTEKISQTEKYQCPMKCEGDKTYDEPGKCPVCGMNLKKTEKKM